MNYFDLYSSYSDPTIATAWESQVKEADKTSWLAEKLAMRESELFARFAACYVDLRALPRSARRALQRRIARSAEVAAILPEYLQHRGRRLQHRMAWSLAGAALLLALGQGMATAGTITVTTNDPRVIADGQCSLIEAINNANNDAATFPDCAPGSGADTIVLPNANVLLSAGLPLITSQITIEGNGATIARQESAPAFGLISVSGKFGNLTLHNLTLSGGSSDGGGGVSNVFGTVTIENSTITGNTATHDGGGVWNYGGTVTIRNSTVSGNTANVGGGLGNTGVCYFGCQSATLIIENSTISDNHANQGGGISNNRVCYALDCSSATGNLNFKNSVIAGNQAPVAPEIVNTSGVTANNFNLFGTNGNGGVTGFTPGPTDIVPSVPLAQILGPLKNNGGRTDTHALVAGSPAIDAGNPNGCRDSAGVLLQTDQRGFIRLDDGNFDGTSRCDIGAYELTNIIALSSSTFVRQQYLDFLDRDPEAAGLSGWANALDGGFPRASLIEAFMDSEEFFFKGKFIAQTYLGLLSRDADYAGFRSWLGALLAGLSREQIVQAFFDSGEFQSRFGSNLTNGQFVERMYNNILLRSSDPGELNVWVGALNNGQLTKAQMALSFLDSGEFQGLFLSQNRVDISLLYFDMLQRDPDAGGFSNWVEVLSSGVSLTSVIDGFLNSPEYRAGF